MPTAALAAGLVAALPLVVDPDGWFVYLPLRWLALVLVVGVLAVVARGSRLPLRAPAGFRCWLALVAVALLSAALSSGPRVSLLGASDRFAGASTWLLHGGLAVLGAVLVRRRADLVLVARALSVALLAVVAVTLAQRGGWSFPAGASSFARPGGPFGNANFLGAYCVLVVPIAAGLALDRDERPGWRTLGAWAAVAGVGGAVLSGSRASWIAVAAAGIALTGWWVRRDGAPDATPSATLGTRARPGARAALAVAAALAFVVAIGAVSGAASRLDDVTGGTARGRVDTWAVALDVVAQRPVLGWGPEGFAEGAAGTIDDRWEQQYGRRLTPDRAHNGLLDVAASVGLVGLAAYLGVIVATGRSAARLWRTDRGDPTRAHRSVVAGAIVALAAYLAHQQTLFPLFDVDGTAWFVAGALASLAGGGAPPERDGKRPATAVAERVARPLRTVALVTAAAIWAAAVGTGTLIVLADRDARAAADALATGDGTTALQHAAGSLRRSPGQTLPALVAADAALLSGEPAARQRALDLVRAARSSGFDDGRLSLAEARLLLAGAEPAQRERAGSLLVALVQRDPARSEAWLLLGDARADDGRLEEAATAWARAARLSPGRRDPWMRLATANERLGRDRDALAAIRELERLLADGESLPPELALLRARLEVGRGPTS